MKLPRITARRLLGLGLLLVVAGEFTVANLLSRDAPVSLQGLVGAFLILAGIVCLMGALWRWGNLMDE